MHTIVRQDRDCTIRLPVDEQFGLGAAIQGIVIGAHDPPVVLVEGATDV